MYRRQQYTSRYRLRLGYVILCYIYNTNVLLRDGQNEQLHKRGKYLMIGKEEYNTHYQQIYNNEEYILIVLIV
jgi:hypothetical protein